MGNLKVLLHKYFSWTKILGHDDDDDRTPDGQNLTTLKYDVDF